MISNYLKVNRNAQVLATNVGDFDSVIMIASHPICIKICHEDKCNLKRPKGQCKRDLNDNLQARYANTNSELIEPKIFSQPDEKNDGKIQRNKRDIFLEYSSHDPITDLLKKVGFFVTMSFDHASPNRMSVMVD